MVLGSGVVLGRLWGGSRWFWVDLGSSGAVLGDSGPFGGGSGVF